jgi:hypothetical protein
VIFGIRRRIFVQDGSDLAAERHPVVGPGLVHRCAADLAATLRRNDAQRNVAHQSARVIGRSPESEHYGEAAIIALSSVLAFFALGQRWGSPPPTKASMGVAGMHCCQGVPATS